MKRKILQNIPIFFILIIGIILCINISYKMTVTKLYKNTYTEKVIAERQSDNKIIYEYNQIKYSGTVEINSNNNIEIWINPNNPKQYIETNLSTDYCFVLFILFIVSCCIIIGSVVVLIL